MVNLNGWIPVRKRFPEKGKLVWITNGLGWVNLGVFIDKDETGVLWALSDKKFYDTNDEEITTEYGLSDEDEIFDYVEVAFWHEVPKLPSI